MAFANVAGRAGFVIDLDKSALDTGLPKAEQQFTQAYGKMTSASKSFSQQFEAEARANLVTAKGRSLVAAATTQAANDLTGSYTRLSDRQTVLARTGRDATAALGRGAGLAGSLGAIGVGAAVGIQALGEASQALRVTGSDASTTTGRVRNLGAELLQGNVVGGLKALASGALAPQAALDALVERSAAAGNQVELDAIKAKTASLGWSDLTKQLDAASAAVTGLAAQNALDFSIRTQNVVDTPTGPVAINRGSLPDDRGGLRGPGGAAGLPSPRLDDPFAGRVKRVQDAATKALLSKDVVDDLSAQKAIVGIARDRLAAATKGTDDYRKLYAEWVATVVAQRQIQDQIDGQQKSAQDAAASKAQQVASDRKAAAEKAASARKVAAEQAARQLRDGLAATQKELENAYQAALITRGTSDDRRSFSKLTSFLGRESRDDRLDRGERAGFAGTLVNLRKQRIDDARRATEGELKAQETILQNNVRAAEKTEKNKADDIRALRKLDAFYDRESRDKAIARQARLDYAGKKLETDKKLRDLTATKKSDSSEFDKFTFAFLQQLKGVNNQAPNVTVNQNFATPTQDQHRETIYMRRAVESSYQTHGF